MDILITVATLLGGVVAAFTLGDRFGWGRGEAIDPPDDLPAPSSSAARQLVYVPEVRTDTVLLFTRRDTSWSLRDYSGRGEPALIEGHTLPDSAEDLLARSRWTRPAPTRHTEDVGFWRDQVETVNAVLLEDGGRLAA